MRKTIRIVTPIVTKGFRKTDDFKALEDGGIEISHVGIDRGPGSIECELDEALAIPDTVAKIIEAEQDGIDAVVIDCMGDPGLKAGRECVSMPVFGPAETSMHLASMLGHRFTVLTVLERLRPFFETLAMTYGVGGNMASVRAVDVPVLELEEDLERVSTLLTEQGRLAVVEDHADVLIFGCTGMLGCAEAVREGLLAQGIDVPVIDPVPATVQIAAGIVRAGLAHSKRTYGMPPVKAIVGYDLKLARPPAQAAE